MEGNQDHQPKIEAVKCKRCLKDIFFAETDNGKMHPFNLRRSPVIIEREGKLIYTVGYTSHFTTCPFANEFRRQSNG